MDVVSSYWQPSYKGVGRWQLELAHLGAKQGQDLLLYSQRLMRCTNPLDAVSETMNHWQRLAQHYGEASQNMASAAVKAAQPPAVFSNAFEVLPLPVKKSRDTLHVPDFDEPELPFERKVA